MDTPTLDISVINNAPLSLSHSRCHSRFESGGTIIHPYSRRWINNLPRHTSAIRITDFAANSLFLSFSTRWTLSPILCVTDNNKGMRAIRSLLGYIIENDTPRDSVYPFLSFSLSLSFSICVEGPQALPRLWMARSIYLLYARPNHQRNRKGFYMYIRMCMRECVVCLYMRACLRKVAARWSLFGSMIGGFDSHRDPIYYYFRRR